MVSLSNHEAVLTGSSDAPHPVAAPLLLRAAFALVRSGEARIRGSNMEVWYFPAFFGGLVVFFGTHMFSAFRTRGEGDIALRMGRGPYMGLY